MVAPYTPPLLANPVVNPRVGGFVRAQPYISISQYRYAPTAMDTDSLMTEGSPTQADQDQSLANVVNRVTSWMNGKVFGSSPSAKGASLCCSQTTEDLWVFELKGQYNLECSYTPILQLDAIAIGSDPSNVVALDQVSASMARFGHRTIYVPAVSQGFLGAGPQPALTFNRVGPDGKTYCVWTYTNGYPHLALQTSAQAGAVTLTVVPNGPGTSLLGVYPYTTFVIEDGVDTENVSVVGVTNNVLQLGAPLNYAHTVPAPPDFIPVTALPADLQQAAIFLTTALIKTRGDASFTLDGALEPRGMAVQRSAYDVSYDIHKACELLDKYRIPSKFRS